MRLGHVEKHHIAGGDGKKLPSGRKGGVKQKAMPVFFRKQKRQKGESRASRMWAVGPTPRAKYNAEMDFAICAKVPKIFLAQGRCPQGPWGWHANMAGTESSPISWIGSGANSGHAFNRRPQGPHADAPGPEIFGPISRRDVFGTSPRATRLPTRM